MALSPETVLARHVFANEIPLGETKEYGSVRIHRYADHFQVTDLAFAGKRGKKVRIMSLAPTYEYKGKPAEWMDRMSKALPDDFSLISTWKLTDRENPNQPANDAGEGEKFQDTMYYPATKKDAKVFYNWLKANQPEAKKMTLDDFRKLWQSIGVKYDYQ